MLSQILRTLPNYKVDKPTLKDERIIKKKTDVTFFVLWPCIGE